MKRLLFAVCFLSLFIAGAQPPVTQPAAPPRATVIRPGDSKIPQRKRQREGSTFQGKIVSFQMTGNRVTLFTQQGDERFVCLENVNLDRIMQSIRANPAQRFWSIDGMYTEFQGENYVFVQRAVLSLPAGKQ